jgi:hypothetical protein
MVPKMRLRTPYNFRELHSAHLPAGCPDKIAGMGYPGRYQATGEIEPELVGYDCRYLNKQGYAQLLSLDTSHLQPLIDKHTEENAITHLAHTIGDWTPPTAKDFDTVYQAVKNADGPITIHCMAGDGRTGTQMAALVLRRLIEDDIKGIALTSDNTRPAKDKSITPSYIDEEEAPPLPTPCSSRVATAITIVRELKSPDPLCTPDVEEISIDSVETSAEIEALCDYEQTLLERAQRLQAKKRLSLSTTCATRPIDSREATAAGDTKAAGAGTAADADSATGPRLAS